MHVRCTREIAIYELRGTQGINPTFNPTFVSVCTSSRGAQWIAA